MGMYGPCEADEHPARMVKASRPGAMTFFIVHVHDPSRANLAHAATLRSQTAKVEYTPRIFCTIDAHFALIPLWHAGPFAAAAGRFHAPRLPLARRRRPGG